MEQRFDLNNHRYYVESFPDGHQELVIKDHEQSGEEWVEHMYNVFRNDTDVAYHIMGNWTYVYDAHGHFGKARKSDEDRFCRNTGIAIAYARMKGMLVHKDFVGEKKNGDGDNGLVTFRPYNGWVMCLNNIGNLASYTPGKLYKFHDGILTDNDGDEMKKVYSFEEWKEFSSSKWKEMTNSDLEDTADEKCPKDNFVGLLELFDNEIKKGHILYKRDEVKKFIMGTECGCDDKN